MASPAKLMVPVLEAPETLTESKLKFGSFVMDAQGVVAAAVSGQGAVGVGEGVGKQQGRLRRVGDGEQGDNDHDGQGHAPRQEIAEIAGNYRKTL